MPFIPVVLLFIIFSLAGYRHL